jgi:Cysteine-rich secretory protein family
VQKINAYRATLSLPPLVQLTSQEICTDGEAKSDADSGTPHSAFGSCGETAQDECPGWPGPPGTLIVDCLAQMWAEGPGGGHYENMATQSRTKVSCGFYQTASGSWWATQNFY